MVVTSANLHKPRGPVWPSPTGVRAHEEVGAISSLPSHNNPFDYAPLLLLLLSMRVKSVHVFLAAAIYGLVHVMLLLLAGWLGGRFSTLTPLFSTFLSLWFFELCYVEPVSVYLLSE